MAGANYMGGKRNAAKARSRDVTGRIQKQHFSRQRLGALFQKTQSSGTRTSSRPNMGSVLSEFSLLQARQDAHEEEATRAGPRVIHEQSARFHLSSSPKSSPRRSSRLLDVLDTTEPLSMRAEIRRMLAIPDFAGLQDVSTGPRSRNHLIAPRSLTKEQSGHCRSNSTSDFFEPTTPICSYSPNMIPETGAPSPGYKDSTYQSTGLSNLRAVRSLKAYEQSSESCLPSLGRPLLSSPVSLLDLDTSPAGSNFGWPTRILPCGAVPRTPSPLFRLPVDHLIRLSQKQRPSTYNLYSPPRSERLSDRAFSDDLALETGYMRQSQSPVAQPTHVSHDASPAEVLPLDLVEDQNPWNTIDTILDLPSVDTISTQHAHSFDRKGVGYISPELEVDASNRQSQALYDQRSPSDVASCYSRWNDSVRSFSSHDEGWRQEISGSSSSPSSTHSLEAKHDEPSEETGMFTWRICPRLSPISLIGHGEQPKEASSHRDHHFPILELEVNRAKVVEVAEAPKTISLSVSPNTDNAGRKHSTPTQRLGPQQPETHIQSPVSHRSSNEDHLTTLMKPFEGPRLFCNSDDEDEW